MAKGTSVRRGNPRLFGVGGFEGMGWKREVGCVGEWGFELVEEGGGNAVGGWWLESGGVMGGELVDLEVVLEGWGLIWLRVLHLKLLGISEGMGDVTDWFG